MGDAEDGADELGLRSTDIQLQQSSLHRVERFEALVEEGVMKLGQIECHDYLSTRCIVATSCSGSKGLTIQPVAPAALPSRLRSAEDSVVNMRIGVCR